MDVLGPLQVQSMQDWLSEHDLDRKLLAELQSNAIAVCDYEVSALPPCDVTPRPISKSAVNVLLFSTPTAQHNPSACPLLICCLVGAIVVLP